jgi:hypothetical protein
VTQRPRLIADDAVNLVQQRNRTLLTLFAKNSRGGRGHDRSRRQRRLLASDAQQLGKELFVDGRRGGGGGGGGRGGAHFKFDNSKRLVATTNLQKKNTFVLFAVQFNEKSAAIRKKEDSTKSVSQSEKRRDIRGLEAFLHCKQKEAKISNYGGGSSGIGR